MGLKIVQYFFKMAAILVVLIVLWHLVLPGLFVLSFVPQISKPPINYFTREPSVIQINPHLDLYETKSRTRGGLVIFHAANELGKDDPRLQNLAKIFARAGFDVWVPTLQNLNRQKFHPAVIEEMKDVILLVKNQRPNEPITLFSFSIGVGPELIAASKSEIKDSLDLIIAFGGYQDLENVVAFHTTGQGQDPFGIWLLARYYAQFLPTGDAQIFYEIADRKWQDINAEISDLAEKLGGDGQRALALLENKDPEAVDELIANLPAELKDFFEVFDPKSAIPNLKSEILLLHSRRDPVIPFAESEKLFATLKRAGKEAEFIELRVFDHVNPVFPDLTVKNFFTLYLPEFWNLYRAVWQVVY